MYDIIELNSKLVSELKDIAKELNIDKIEGLKKQDLIYTILDHQALNPGKEKEPETKSEPVKRKPGRPRKNKPASENADSSSSAKKEEKPANADQPEKKKEEKEDTQEKKTRRRRRIVKPPEPSSKEEKQQSDLPNTTPEQKPEEPVKDDISKRED